MKWKKATKQAKKRLSKSKEGRKEGKSQPNKQKKRLSKSKEGRKEKGRKNAEFNIQYLELNSTHETNTQTDRQTN